MHYTDTFNIWETNVIKMEKEMKKIKAINAMQL